MIRFILFIFSLFIFQISNAQFDKDKYTESLLKKGLISIEGGIGIPFQEFASTSPSNARAGYAMTGYSFSASFKYAIVPTFGLSLKYFSTTNPFDVQKMNADLNSGSSYTSTFASDPYYLSGLMLGPTYIFPTSKMNFETSIFVGKLSGTLPANTTQFSPPIPYPISINGMQQMTKFVNTYQTSYTASDYAVSFEAAIRYMISKNLIISASADVIICDLTFRSITQYFTDTAGNTLYTNLPDYLQPFRLVHLKLGIGYQFD